MSIRRANRLADSLRDRRLWREAANAYAGVLRLAPKRSDIWVQYGHALKESGDVAGAKAAYDRALDLDPKPADTWLQLGHALKLLEHREEAIRAYACALQRQPDLTGAVNEIIELSDSSRARLHPGHGFDVLQDAVKRLSDVRVALGGIEKLLPPITALNSFTHDQFDLFRQLFRTPAPPPGTAQLSCCAVVIPHLGSNLGICETLRSLRGQANRPSRTTLILSDSGWQGGTDEFRGITIEPTAGRPVTQVIGQLASQSAEDYFLLVLAGTSCDPSATQWLQYVFGNTLAELAIPDEVLVVQGPDFASKQTPILRECPTDLNWQEIVPATSLLGFRRSALVRCLNGERGTVGDSYKAWLSSLGDAVVPCHIPRLLAMTGHDSAHSQDVAGLPLGGSQVLEARPERRQVSYARICLIVPTRDLGDYLKRCLSTARVTAANGHDLEVVVIDNQSKDPATLEYLRAEAGRGTRILRDDAPFSWSRASNIGAFSTEAEILVFLNNDIEFLREGWDEVLRLLLCRAEVGAVGARLLYPHGAVQHAGIVFRTSAMPEHDGRDVVATDAGLRGRWLTRRYVSAVTGAFLAVRRADFVRCGGFDEVNLPIWFSDLDLCLKLRSHSHIVYEPAIELIHHESKTIKKSFEDEVRHRLWQRSASFMRQKWGAYLHFDPSYNPHYVSWGAPFKHIAEPSEWNVEKYIELGARQTPWLVPPR